MADSSTRGVTPEAGGTESVWTPPPRPDWLRQVNDEGACMDIVDLVPLDAEELIATACRSTGLSDFGEDSWREPFAVLIKSLNEQADLNLFGRLHARDEMLRALKVRLQIADEYARHPEIEDEVVAAPVVITGLPRSGTSILFEILSQDLRFKPLLSWEIVLPCPPPDAANYESDPRIDRAEAILTRFNRAAPSFRTMHEMGARTPNECSEAFIYAFMSENLLGRYDVPDYASWLARHVDWQQVYRYYHRLLKLLQWKNPRQHWLLKAPPHLWHLEHLFATFPDAKVVMTHRDPMRCNASGASLVGTLRWMWSDKPFDPASFEKMLSPEATAAGLEHVISQLVAGDIPRRQIFDSHYADLMQQPLKALRALYQRMGLMLDAESAQRIRRFLENKPKGKFGAHQYQTLDDPHARACYTRYQHFFGVADES